MKKIIVVLFIALAMSCSDSKTKELKVVTEEKASGEMTNQKLGTLISKYATKIKEGSRLGYWEFELKNRSVICITDVNANRMRIISPIVSVTEITEKHLQDALAANFHTALDARYAVSNGVVWSAFIHPLKELSIGEVESAIYQVVTASETFGTTYQSSGLFFNKANSSEKQKNIMPKHQEEL